jgi:translation initiation factor 3 subunit H
MKIVKHCHDSLPQMVTGSVLGLVVDNGILEVTHAFPSPDSGKEQHQQHHHHQQQQQEDVMDNINGEDFQLEMMRMLREVNVDNNCVGWYQSMYLGIYSTASVLETQFSYQTDLSPNAVVLLYDPLQTTKGEFCIKAFRLTDECLQLKKLESNDFIKPSNIFEELPVTCTNPQLANAMLQDWTFQGVGKEDIALQRLDLSTHPYLEKHLEFLCGWVDELAGEQHKFQYYTRHLAKGGGNKSASAKAAGWTLPEAPKRMESLLLTNQINNYCTQMDKFAGGGLGKLFVAGGLHKEKPLTTSSETN